MGIDFNTVLFCRCGYDDVDLRHLNYWLGKMIPEARKLGFNVIDLNEEKFNRERVIDELSEKEPFLVIFCGHGNDGTIFGHNGKKVIRLCNEDRYFEGKVVIAFSCKTAGSLCRSAKSKGCNTYCGWTWKLRIPSRGCADARRDECSGPCIKALLQLPLSIMKGDNPKKAYEKCLSELESLADAWRGETKFIPVANFLDAIMDGLLIDYQPITQPPAT